MKTFEFSQNEVNEFAMLVNCLVYQTVDPEACEEDVQIAVDYLKKNVIVNRLLEAATETVV